MRLLLLLTFVSLAGCLGGEPSQDLGPTGQIDGAALNHVLVPYGNVTVRLVEMDWTTTTTELGGFSFYDVPVGFYTLELEVLDGLDREIVAVEEDRISRVILQVYPDEVTEPHVTLRSDVEIVQLAMPGERCEECAWRTSVSEGRPEAVELLVEWDPRHPVVADWQTRVEVTLLDQDDNVIMGPLEGAEEVGQLMVIHALVDGEDLREDLSTLKVDLVFAEDNEAPHPDFQVDSRICMHYVETEPQTACSV